MPQESNALRQEAQPIGRPEHVLFDDKCWQPLALSVIRDPRISAAALVYVAHRNTFVGEWAHKDATLLGKERIVRGEGFGRDVIEGARAELVRAGYLDRWQPARGADGLFQPAKEVLKLPVVLQRSCEGLMVWRKWFDGRLSVKEMAAYLYLRAGSGKGPAVYARELEVRFGWQPRTVLKVLNGLIKLDLVRRSKKHSKGRITGVTYHPLIAHLWKPTATKQKPGHGLQGHGLQGHLLTFGLPHDTPSPKDSPVTHDLVGRQYTSLREAPTFEDLFREGLDLLGEAQEGVDLDPADIDVDVVYRLWRVLPDADIITAVRSACRQRVSKSLLTPTGAMGMRILAALHATSLADEFEYDDAPVAAMKRLLEYLRLTIGKRGKRLSSLNYLLKATLGFALGSGAGAWQRVDADTTSDTPQGEAPRGAVPAGIAEALRDADTTGALHPSVFKDGAGLLALMHSYGGDNALDIICVKLGGLAWDGRTETQYIRSWKYLGGVLADEAYASEMQRLGLRPGDVLPGAKRGRQ